MIKGLDDDDKGSEDAKKMGDGKGHAGLKREMRPWRVSQDGKRACVDVVIAGVGYLLYVHLFWSRLL